jgi:two-component system response regulator AtoC
MMDDFRIRFLVVDDQQSIRKLCMTIGTSLGFVSSEAESAEAALAQVEAESPDIILCDLKMAEMSGLEFLDEVKKILPRTEIAMMTGYGSIESAVQAMKLGAYDYISKPFRVDEMKQRLQRMAEKVRLVAENEFLRDRVTADMQLNGIVGSSAKIQDVLRMIARLKDTRTPVLITGESGTGKELVARAIHFRGALAKRPFVTVDCGSLVPTLIESELFGYEKGAFTGAIRAKAGLFESANGGTIFLDEIGELPLEMQAKLLRVLQEKEIRPVGSNKTIKIEVRVIAATNRDLESAVTIDDLRDRLASARARLADMDCDQQRTINEVRGLQSELDRLPRMPFRKDLFFRINVVSIHLPAVRERKSDIPSLVNYFLDRFAPKQNVTVTPAAMNSLLQYDWPGNVRELENCMERAIALGNHQTIDVHDLPPAIRRSAERQEMREGTPLSATDLEDLERITIERVFEQVKGDKALAGKMLGISRATLYRKLKRYGIGGRQEQVGLTDQSTRAAIAGLES